MELKQYRFEEVTINFDKMRFPLSGAQRDRRKGEYRYYGAQGVIDYIDDYIFDGVYLLIAEDGENLKSKKQNIAQIAEGQFWVNNHAHIVQGNELCDTRYLSYLVNSMDLSGYITGSAQPKLSQSNLNAISVFIPNVSIQRKIVEYLYLIDKKIEINQRINNNLEQQAISIFNNNIAILSKNGQLGDYCSVKSGFAFKSAWWTTSGIRVIKIGSINQDALDLNACSYVAPDKVSFAADFTVKGGDLLIAMTGATIGKFAMVPQTSDILLVNQRVGKFF